MDEIEPNLHQREDYYLAQIAYRLALGQVKKPEELRIEQFLIKHQSSKEQDTPQPIPITEEQRELKVQKSKMAWLGWIASSFKK